MSETKSEIRARLDELKIFRQSIGPWLDGPALYEIDKILEERMMELKHKSYSAEEDLFRSVVKSHYALCSVKNMDLKAAYGQDPAMYYTMGICGEAGEMANKIVKALRNGDSPEKTREAVISELPDIIIYSAVLAFVLDIDLAHIVNEKAQIVTDRAESGYYGHAFKDRLSPASAGTGSTVNIPTK
jgi:NTP pyrophosphatase (non-canonical NTP hydrolase)